MAEKIKFSQFPEVKEINSDSIFPAVQDGENVKITYENLAKGLGISDEKIGQAVETYLAENPVQTGATQEQAEQIEKNTEDISKITESLTEKEASGTADSKVSEHNTSETSHSDIRLLIEGLTTRLNALADSVDTTLDQMYEVIENDINNWLDKHPEATTTVQDGVITELKIHSDFLPYIKNGYVTPEMFGAVGDGIYDDSTPLLAAISTGYPVRGKKGSKYATKSQLIFSDDCDIGNIYLIAISEIESVIKYSKRNTRIHNVQIDCNNLADYGILGASKTPSDTLYVADINNCSVINALIDGFNTGIIRTYINNSFAKNCGNAGFYINASDTKHDCITPIDCAYGVYVNAGNTEINRLHPWGWDKKQTGLYVAAGIYVKIQFYYNDTNDIGVVYNNNSMVLINTLENFNNINAPKATDMNSRMLKDIGKENTKIIINNLIGSWENNDDYFLYPDTFIYNMRIDNIYLYNVATRFDKKMFRTSSIVPLLFQQVLEKFNITSDILNINSCTINYCECTLRGYKLGIRVNFDNGNAEMSNLTELLEIQYNGSDSELVEYKMLNVNASYSGLSFHTAIKNNSDGLAKGITIKPNTNFTITNGVLVMDIDLYVKLY